MINAMEGNVVHKTNSLTEDVETISLGTRNSITSFFDKEGKIFFDTVYNTQKKRIFNALKNSNSDSVIKFKEVLKKIINGK